MPPSLDPKTFLSSPSSSHGSSPSPPRELSLSSHGTTQKSCFRLALSRPEKMPPSLDPNGRKTLLFLQHTPKQKQKPKPEALPQRMVLFNIAFNSRFASTSPNRGVRLTHSPLIAPPTSSSPLPPPPTPHKDPPPPPQPPPKGPMRLHRNTRATPRRQLRPTRHSTRSHAHPRATPHHRHADHRCTCSSRAAFRADAPLHALTRASTRPHDPLLLPPCRAQVAYAPPRAVVDAVHRFKLRILSFLAVQHTTSAFLTPSSRTHNLSEPTLCTSNVPPHDLYPSGYPRYDFGRILSSSPLGETELFFGTPPCASPSRMFLWTGRLIEISSPVMRSTSFMYKAVCSSDILWVRSGIAWCARHLLATSNSREVLLPFEERRTPLYQSCPPLQAFITCLGSPSSISRSVVFKLLITYSISVCCSVIIVFCILTVSALCVRVLDVNQYPRADTALLGCNSS